MCVGIGAGGRNERGTWDSVGMGGGTYLGGLRGVGDLGGEK